MRKHRNSLINKVLNSLENNDNSVLKNKKLKTEVENFNNNKLIHNEEEKLDFYQKTIKNLLDILNEQEEYNEIIIDDDLLFEKQLKTPPLKLINDNIELLKNEYDYINAYKLNSSKNNNINHRLRKIDKIIKKLTSNLNDAILENKYNKLKSLFFDPLNETIDEKALLININKKIKNAKSLSTANNGDTMFAKNLMILNYLKEFAIKENMIKKITENKSIFSENNTYKSLNSDDVSEEATQLTNEIKKVYQILLSYCAADHIINTKCGEIVINNKPFHQYNEISYKDYITLLKRVKDYHSLLHQKVDLLGEKILNRVHNNYKILDNIPIKLNTNNLIQSITTLNQEQKDLQKIYNNLEDIKYYKETENNYHNIHAKKKLHAMIDEKINNFLYIANKKINYHISLISDKNIHGLSKEEKENEIIELTKSQETIKKEKQKFENIQRYEPIKKTNPYEALLNYYDNINDNYFMNKSVNWAEIIQKRTNEKLAKEIYKGLNNEKSLINKGSLILPFFPIENNNKIYNYPSMPMILLKKYHYTEFYPHFKK